MIIWPVVTTSNGQLKTLAEVTVPAKCEYFNNSKGSNKNLPEEEPNTRVYGADFKHWMERQAENVKFGQFRLSGVYHFRVCIYHIQMIF